MREKTNYTLFLISNILMCFCVCFVISCSASRHESGDANNTKIEWTIGEIKRKISDNSSRLRSFNAEGDITIDTPEMSNSGSMVVSIIKPDSIFVKIEGPFGLSVASMLITRKNFIYYNAMDNIVFRGNSSSANLSAILNFKINFDDLINSFSGSVVFDDTGDSNSTLTKEGSDIVLTIVDSDKDEVKKYWVDSKYFLINKYNIYNKSGQLLFNAEYTNYENINNLYFPSNITVNKPKEKQHLWLNYTDKTINNNYLNFKLKIPKSAKEINWD